MKEEWRPVVGWEEYYEVSNLGQVRSLPRKLDSGVYWKGQVVKQLINKFYSTPLEYKFISLSAKDRKVKASIHRLVAQAFLPNPNNLPTVNHKDGNPANNHLDNLEWASMAEQRWHARNVLGAGRKSCYKLTDNQIANILHLEGSLTTIAIGAAYGIHPQTVRKIHRGVRHASFSIGRTRAKKVLKKGKTVKKAK